MLKLLPGGGPELVLSDRRSRVAANEGPREIGRVAAGPDRVRVDAEQIARLDPGRSRLLEVGKCAVAGLGESGRHVFSIPGDEMTVKLGPDLDFGPAGFEGRTHRFDRVCDDLHRVAHQRDLLVALDQPGLDEDLGCRHQIESGRAQCVGDRMVEALDSQWAGLVAHEVGDLVGKRSDRQLVPRAAHRTQARSGSHFGDTLGVDAEMLAALDLPQHDRPVGDDEREPRRAHHREQGHVPRAGRVEDADRISGQNRGDAAAGHRPAEPAQALPRDRHKLGSVQPHSQSGTRDQGRGATALAPPCPVALADRDGGDQQHGRQRLGVTRVVLPASMRSGWDNGVRGHEATLSVRHPTPNLRRSR